MRERLTLSIHDEKGLRQVHFPLSVKKTLKIAAVGVVVALLVVAAVIYALGASIGELMEKKQSLAAAVQSERERNMQLLYSVDEAKEALERKQEAYDEMTDRLGNIESMIGLVPSKEMPLSERIELAQLTGEERSNVLQFIPNGSPVEYRGITSKFGYRTHPKLGTRSFHHGTDLKASVGTAIYATADGVVEYGAYHKNSGFGRLIILDHNYGFKTYYGHLKEIEVEPGQYVRRGERIGRTGNSGLSSGPHLHYEVRFLQYALNPYWFIKWTMENYDEIFEKEKKVPWHSLITAINQNRSTTTKPPSSQKVLISKAN